MQYIYSMYTVFRDRSSHFKINETFMAGCFPDLLNFIIVFPIFKKKHKIYHTITTQPILYHQSYQYCIKYFKLYYTINYKKCWHEESEFQWWFLLGKVNNIKETGYTLNAIENKDLVNLVWYTFDRTFPFDILSIRVWWLRSQRLKVLVLPK